MSKPSPTSTTLTPTIPTPLAALYRATSEARVRGGGEALPTISTLLREAMASTLASLGVDPALLAAANPLPSRTSAATAARSRQRLAGRKNDSGPTDGA